MKQSWFYSAWLEFLIRYRRTALGPAWMLVGPGLFIVLLGGLYADIGGHGGEKFVPHLATGLVCWTLINGCTLGSTTVFQRSRAQILQGNVGLFDIVMIDVFSTILTFAHQLIILVFVFAFYRIPLTLYSLVSLVGFVLVVVNGIWLSAVFGIIGARYRDLAEVVQAVMRIAFLATPILWMADKDSRVGSLAIYVLLNPFFHFLELIRAPLLGVAIAPASWAVVLAITLAGFAVARFTMARYARYVALWI